LGSFKIASLEQRLANDNALLVSLDESVRQATQFTWATKRELRDEGLSAEEIKEHEAYIEAVRDVDVVKERRASVMQTIEQTKCEIEELKQQQESGIRKELFAGDIDDTPRPGPSAAFLRFRQGREFPTSTNDGERTDLNADYAEDTIDEGKE
jgi:hypothetical protein